MENIVRTISVVVLVPLIGCGSPNPAMTGSWLFTLTPDGSSSDVILGTANLTQNGSQITGPITLTGNGTVCGSTATMSGTLEGTTLTLQIVQLQSIIQLTGSTNLAFTSASGTFIEMVGGACLQNPGIGTWSALLG